LIDFNVDIYLQRDRVPSGEKIQLWRKDYGLTRQGLAYLDDARKKWDESKSQIKTLEIGDQLFVRNWDKFTFSDKCGIGVVVGSEFLKVTFDFCDGSRYRKFIDEIRWNEKNWRWETDGLG
jgi:hypothetical protein